MGKKRNKNNSKSRKNNPCAICGQSESYDIAIPCDQCHTRYHYSCAKITENNRYEIWKCPECSDKGDDQEETASNADADDEILTLELEFQKMERAMLEMKTKLEMKRKEQHTAAGTGRTNIQTSSPIGHSTSYPRTNAQRTQAPTGITFDLPPEREQSTYSSCDLSLYARHMASRQSTPKELPEFSGRPVEWPLFYSAFLQSTELCRYSDNENLLRLQKSLKGKAREIVEPQLTLPSAVPDIMATLEMVFGRPEYIIDQQLALIRKAPLPKADKLETIVTYSISVSNLTSILEHAQMNEHLNNPMLLRELVERLPPSMKLDWATQKENIESTTRTCVNVKHFSSWLHKLSKKICSVTKIYQDDESNAKPKNQKFSGVHCELDERKNDNETEEERKCGVCKGQRHKCLADCEKFHELPVNKRWSFVSAFRLCHICLKGHRPYCRKTEASCTINGCTEPHHPLLHKDKAPPTPKPNGNDPTHGSDLHAAHVTTQKIIYPIIPITIVHMKNKINTYAFVDSGSTVTMIENWVVDELNVKGDTEPLHLKWTGGTTRVEEESKRVELQIRGQGEENKVYRLQARSVNNLELPSQTLEVSKLKNSFEYLKDLPIQPYKDAKPAILIGLDNWSLVNSIGTREGKAAEPVASKCRLGWLVKGSLGTTTASTSNVDTVGIHLCECQRSEDLHELIKSYFEFDHLPTAIQADSYSMEEKRADKILKETVKLVSKKRYESGLLWKYNSFDLPNSRPMALKRYLCLETKLRTNPEMLQEIRRQIEAYIDKGYARKLTLEETQTKPNRVWYLPIFPVVNPKKPGRVRIVFDAAAKVHGISLNDMLIKGPDLTASLFGVLIRFRQKKVALTGDVSEMFHQVRVRPEDQDVQRFISRDENGEIVDYVLEVLSFGATCSPAIAQYVKNFVATSFKHKYNDASNAIINDTYVDDVLTNANDPEAALKLGQEISLVLAEAGFNIRNWRSNSEMVQQNLEPNETTNKENLDLTGGVQIEKVLGMFWRTNDDTIVYSFKYNKGNEAVLKGKKQATKRELLKIQMSIYDPLGLIAHYIIQIKILIQDIWRTGSGWDEEISNEHQKRFEYWLSHIPEIESLSIPRCYLNSFDNWENLSTQLHTFVDAGGDAYASVTYLRTEKNGVVECHLISAKTRVAPVKITSVPRLELEAARLGARHAKAIRESLTVDVNKTIYWTDSETVLAWLHSDARSNPAFVAHRISEIQDTTDIADWRYVPTGKNVADEASKKRESYKITDNSRWYRGPEFLYKTEEHWPRKTNKHVKPVHVHENHNREIDFKLNIDPEKFSCWSNLTRVVARVIHYCNILKAKAKKTRLNNIQLLTTSEMTQSEKLLLKMAQREVYYDEIKTLMNGQTLNHKSKIIAMNPYLDEHGLLRSKSRLEFCNLIGDDTKMPTIMPPKHWITKLIVRYYHERLHHQNHETVVNNIRQRFWIPTLREVLRRVRNDCAKCRILTATPKEPIMAPLPVERVSITRPFAHVGIDYFGPIPVTVGRTTQNRYGVLFTCLNIRAVYIHVAHSLSTDSFILAFQTFISRRGQPRVVYSDRGTNFIGAERILKMELKKLNLKELAEHFISAELDWKFNPPLSPHMGGAWERMVRSVKTALYASLPKSRRFDDETLVAFLALSENTVNSHPLTYLPTDQADTALTPNEFILGSGDGKKPIAPLSDDREIIKNSWKKAEECTNLFWKRWVTEYLPTLTRRTKWTKPTKPLEVDDIVMIVDKNLPRNCWPKGRVIEVVKAKDNQVRSATVQTLSGIYNRPAVMLAKLDLSAPEPSVTMEHAGGNVAEDDLVVSHRNGN